MNMAMNDDNVVSVAPTPGVREALKQCEFSSVHRDEAYEWIGNTLGKFRYFSESKKNRGLVKGYIQR